MSKQRSVVGLGVLTAAASSLCCISPLMAIVAGSTGLVANLHWIEPLRPWLIGATLAALGLAWYLQFKSTKPDDCECDDRETPFWSGKTFLTSVTLLSVIMITFPLYANAFYPKPEMENHVSLDQVEQVKFEISGMTCSGCEGHVEHAVSQLPGVVEVQASFEDANAYIIYDTSQINLASIRKAIISTSYEVGKHEIVKSSNTSQ